MDQTGIGPKVQILSAPFCDMQFSYDEMYSPDDTTFETGMLKKNGEQRSTIIAKQVSVIA